MIPGRQDLQGVVRVTGPVSFGYMGEQYVMQMEPGYLISRAALLVLTPFAWEGKPPTITLGDDSDRAGWVAIGDVAKPGEVGVYVGRKGRYSAQGGKWYTDQERVFITIEPGKLTAGEVAGVFWGVRIDGMVRR